MVAAAVTDHHRLLTARRTTPEALAGRWEFPGGKVESGETHQEALAREVTEELGIQIRVGQRVGSRTLAGVGILHVYLCYVDTNAPLQLLDHHDQVRWVRQEECLSLPWASGDAALLASVWALIDIGIGFSGVPRDN